MAILSELDRAGCWANTMRRNIGSMSITKTELRAAVDALDDFMDTNASTINSAIPQPARSSLTTKQKAAILMLVIEQRYEVA
jgi:hypothetical protein